MSSFKDNSNTRSTAGVNGFTDTIVEILVPNPGDSDTRKFSNCQNVECANKYIVGAAEDCLDLCRVDDSTFNDLLLEPKGNNGITIKGASNNVSIHATFHSHGKQCDVELGQFDNYWYVGRYPTENISLFVASTTGKPVKIRVWDGEVGVISTPADGPGFTVTYVPKFVWFPYFCFRYAQLRLENLIRKFRKQPLIATR